MGKNMHVWEQEVYVGNPHTFPLILLWTWGEVLPQKSLILKNVLKKKLESVNYIIITINSSLAMHLLKQS